MFNKILNKAYTIDVNIVDEEAIERRIRAVVIIHRNLRWFINFCYRCMKDAVIHRIQDAFRKYSIQNDYFNIRDVEKLVIEDLQKEYIKCTDCKVSLL